MMENPILEYRHVSVAYQKKIAVNDISFTLRPGEILAIAGESGSGKSTILKAVFGLLSTQGQIIAGDILYHGQSLLKNDQEVNRALFGKEIAMVFQNSEASLHPFYTVEKNLFLIVREHQKLDKEKIRKKALELLTMMNIQDGMRVLKSYPHELSGGIVQRVGMMLAMIMEPQILICDEPTSALDAIAQKQVIDALLLFQKKSHCAILMVSHNMALIHRVASLIAVIHKGKIIEMGSKENIFNHPQHDYTKKLIETTKRIRKL